jgi:hypothetical protein
MLALALLSASSAVLGDAQMRGRTLAVPSPTALATTISASRFTIDRFNLTFTLASDEPMVSIGASDDFGDGLGSLKATAVCFKTGSNTNISSPFIPTRVDFLLYKKSLQSRDTITDLSLTLFSDDGTTSHNPYRQVRARCHCARGAAEASVTCCVRRFLKL